MPAGGANDSDTWPAFVWIAAKQSIIGNGLRKSNVARKPPKAPTEQGSEWPEGFADELESQWAMPAHTKRHDAAEATSMPKSSKYSRTFELARRHRMHVELTQTHEVKPMSCAEKFIVMTAAAIVAGICLAQCAGCTIAPPIQRATGSAIGPAAGNDQAAAAGLAARAATGAGGEATADQASPAVRATSQAATSGAGTAISAPSGPITIEGANTQLIWGLILLTIGYPTGKTVNRILIALLSTAIKPVLHRLPNIEKPPPPPSLLPPRSQQGR